MQTYQDQPHDIFEAPTQSFASLLEKASSSQASDLSIRFKSMKRKGSPNANLNDAAEGAERKWKVATSNDNMRINKKGKSHQEIDYYLTVIGKHLH